MGKKESKSVEFSGTFSTYVTMIGYLLGMADVWRFPFLVYRNGGGAFLIPFIITMVICGVPLYFLEYSISKFSGKGPYKIWDVCPIFRGAGITIIATYLIYIAGSSVFRGYLSVFLINTFKDPLPWTTCDNPWNTHTCKANPFIDTGNATQIGHFSNKSLVNTAPSNVSGTTIPESTFNKTNTGMTAAEEFWQFEALKLSSGVTDFYPLHWRIIIFMVVLRLLVMLCAFKSIKSIEKVMYFTTFIPLMVSAAVFVRSLMLPGASTGLYKFYYPEFSKLANPRVWIEAFLMAFYSLSFGWGGLLTLGSHAKFRENCVRNAIVVPLIDGFVGIVSSSICFSVLGNMAHAYNVGMDEVINAGLSVGVVSYVTALSAFPFPQLWNFVFLLSVLLVGLDTQIVPVEMSMQIIGEMFPNLYPKYRIHTLAVMTIGLFLLSLPTCTGAGAYWFLWIDWYAGVWVGPICGFIELIAVGWIYGVDRFSADVSLMIGRPISRFFRWTIAFVSPTVVFMVFVTSIVEYVPPRYGSYTYKAWSRVVGWLLVTVLMTPMVVKAILIVKNQKGNNLRQNLKKSIQCTKDWGPKEPRVQEQFECQNKILKNRSFKQLLHFTLFGRYSETSELNVIGKEMSIMIENSSDKD